MLYDFEKPLTTIVRSCIPSIDAKADVLEPVVDDLLVQLVGEDDEIVATDDLRELLERLARQCRGGRVCGRDEREQLRFLRQPLSRPRLRNLEVVGSCVGSRRAPHPPARCSPRTPYNKERPAGLVAGVEERLHDDRKRLLRAVVTMISLAGRYVSPLSRRNFSAIAARSSGSPAGSCTSCSRCRARSGRLHDVPGRRDVRLATASVITSPRCLGEFQEEKNGLSAPLEFALRVPRAPRGQGYSGHSSCHPLEPPELGAHLDRIQSTVDSNRKRTVSTCQPRFRAGLLVVRRREGAARRTDAGNPRSGPRLLRHPVNHPGEEDVEDAEVSSA